MHSRWSFFTDRFHVVDANYQEHTPLLPPNQNHEITVKVGEYVIFYSKMQQLEPLLKTALEKRLYYPDRIEEAYLSMLEFCVYSLNLSLALMTGAILYLIQVVKSNTEFSNWHQIIIRQTNKTCDEMYGNLSGCFTSSLGGGVQIRGISKESECYNMLYSLCDQACIHAVETTTLASSCNGINQTTLLFCVFIMILFTYILTSVFHMSDHLIRETNHFIKYKDRVFQRNKQYRLDFFYSQKELLAAAKIENRDSLTLKQLFKQVKTQLKIAKPFVLHNEQTRNGLKSANRIINIIEEYSGVSVSHCNGFSLL